MNKPIEYWVASGSAPGYLHSDRMINKQDAVRKTRFEGKIFGVVCDGCSQGKWSEIYANELAQYILNQMLSLHMQKIPIDQLPALLYPMILDFLRTRILQMPFGDTYLAAVDNDKKSLIVFDRNHHQLDIMYDYVTSNMLATIVAFCFDEKDGGIIFWRGDGIYTIGENVFPIENEVQVLGDDARVTTEFPIYIAYDLLPPSTIKTKQGEDVVMPEAGFSVAEVPAKTRFAITSDAFTEDQILQLFGQFRPIRFRKFVAKMKAKGYPDDLQLLWNQYDPIEVQTRINYFSSDREIEDDGAAVVVDPVELDLKRGG